MVIFYLAQIFQIYWYVANFDVLFQFLKILWMWDQLSYDVSTFELTSSNCVNQQLETLLSCESIEETPNHDLTQALVEPYAPLEKDVGTLGWDYKELASLNSKWNQFI